MPINITMPALSPTMEEGNLAKWLVKEGDQVAPGDVIAEIETDKATMEVEAVEEGTVARIVVPAGTEGVKVNALIAVLAGEGEDAEAVSKAQASPPPAPTGKAEEAAPQPQGNGKSGGGDAAEPEPTAPAAAPKPAASAAAPLRQEAATERVFASPLARRIAAEAGIDLAAVPGSGPHGRVVKADVEAAISSGGKAAPASAPVPATAGGAPAPKAMPDEQVMKLFEEGTYQLVPHDAMRKTIARRLVEAKSTVPHFYLTIDCDLDALLALRAQLNAAAPVARAGTDETPAYKISVNDMVIKALALALRDVPAANVSWTEAGMLQHSRVDVGVAVSIPGGLITPIVRRADGKTLSTISSEMKDLGARARNRKLMPEEYQGGTTAVSNLGMFGIKDFSAVINPPHATILAVGAGEERAVARNGEIRVATVMSVTLSTDHRAVDGALGAELLGAFKRYVENPIGMLV